MKNRKSMLILVIIMSVLSFVCLTLSFAYSFVIQSYLDNTMSINSGNLSASINYTSYSDYFVPISDTDALQQSPFSDILIKNDGSYNLFYTIGLKYDTDDTEMVNSYGFLPMENIKFALFSVADNTQLTAPRSIGDCAIRYHDPSNLNNDEYVIYESTLLKNETKNYGIKVWVDENTSSAFDESYLGLKLSINQEPVNSKLRFSLSGTLTYNGTPIEATIVNGVTGQTITSNLDGVTGKFLLSDLFSDSTYPLLVTYNGTTYKTTLYFEHGTEKTVQSSSGNVGASGSYVQYNAFTYHTTVSQIMNANSSIINSNVPINGTYNIPNSYIFKSTVSDVFSDLTMNITSNQIVIS